MTYYNGDLINADEVYAYLDRLVGRVFKILPLCEDGTPTLDVYLQGLLRELLGCEQLAESLKGDGRFVSLLSVLRLLCDDHDDIRVVRSDVFYAINLLKQLQEKYREVGA